MLEAFGQTDPGCVRQNNEDYFLIAQSAGLYLVADGMGGAQAGERASQMAAETVGRVIAKSIHTGEAVLLDAVTEANREVLFASRTDIRLEGMGTTLVAVLKDESKAHIASVGDSRAYVHHRGHFRAVTEDQTWVNEVGRKLGIGEDQLKKHPMRHVLTMAIGVGEKLRINSYTVQLEAGMTFLLCSDGLHGVIAEKEIATILDSGGEMRQVAGTLIEKARQAGGPDNITVVLLRVA